MKDKLPNDRLEEFLRKSLGDHSEEPPGDLWSKIAENLEPPVAVPPKLTPVRGGGWWAVAAAAAVVVGLLVGQHLYFTSKIDQLSKKLEQNVEGLKQLEQEGKTTNLPESETTSGTAAVEETTPASQNGSAEKTLDQQQPESQAGSKNGQKLAAGNEAKNDIAKQKTATKSTLNPILKKSQKEGLDTKSGASDLVNENKSEAPTSTIDPTQKTLENLEKLATEKTDLQRVWSKKLSPLDLPKSALPAITSPIVPASKLATNHFKLGVNAMPLATTSKVHSVRERKPGPGPMDDRKSVKLEKEKSDKAWMAGLAVEAELTPRLSFGAGVSYRSADYQTPIPFEFKFGDKQPGMGPHHDHEHEFQYNLNTAVGTVEMDIRAETALSAMDIPENEKVGGEITINQHFEYLSTPIYASYSLGNGRLKALVKGGLLFNFMRNNEFSIGQIRSLNDKFDFSRREEQSGSPTNLQSITLDYLVGVGLEYSLTKAVSLRLEPTAIGSISSRHNNPLIQSSEFSAGLNAGVFYNF